MSECDIIKITAEAHGNGMINVDTEIMGRIRAECFNTKEQVVHDALVALGWTPPVS